MTHKFDLDFFCAFHKKDMTRPSSVTYIPLQLDLPIEYLKLTYPDPDIFLDNVIEYRMTDLYSGVLESLGGIIRVINYQIWIDLAPFNEIYYET